MRKFHFAVLAATLMAAPLLAAPQPGPGDESHTRHVLLISVDGLHALDVSNYIANHPKSALAELSRHGVTYSNARTPANSDSFPGLLALVTGGSPISHGMFYDVSYDRTYFDPTNTTCAGKAGNNMIFDETIDVYNAANVSLDVIDPAKLAAPPGERTLRARLSPRRHQEQHHLRSGQSRRRTHGLGRQAPRLRPGERSLRQRCR